MRILVLPAALLVLVAGCSAPEPAAPPISAPDAVAGAGHHGAHGADEAKDGPHDAHDNATHDGDGSGLPSGPAAEDASGVFRACVDADDVRACHVDQLKVVLYTRGSIAAFDILAHMADADVAVQRAAHPMAHDLGRYAYTVHGNITRTLETCSYKVFQGCFHGALQQHFETIPALDESSVDVCPEAGRFDTYVCMHGLGHGLMLATRYDLDQSLALCDALDSGHARRSCYGGAFMENIVAYQASRSGDDHAHGHGGDAPVEFWVDEERPDYPCVVLDARYVESCWLIQTSLSLTLLDHDFAAAASLCGELPDPIDDSCFTSIGRDASAYADRDPAGVAERCPIEPASGRTFCIQGFVSEVVHNAADPRAGLPACAGLPEEDKRACAIGLGWAGHGIVGRDAMLAICDEMEPDHRTSCRVGVDLPRRD